MFSMKKDENSQAHKNESQELQVLSAGIMSSNVTRLVTRQNLSCSLSGIEITFNCISHRIFFLNMTTEKLSSGEVTPNLNETLRLMER